ncbi:MAG: helix-turn-helix domain-containing protein [Burkholderiaceae bacterium]
MSEPVEQVSGAALPGTAEPGFRVTAGALLRQAREAAGLHLATLAASLKVPVNKLEALEADRTDLLPDAVFARALASSVCRTLKIDPAPVLERLPQLGAPRLATDDASINAPFRTPSDNPKYSVLEQLSRPVALAVLALLLGALVLIFLPSVKRDEVVTGAAPAEVVTTAPTSAGPATSPMTDVPATVARQPATTSPSVAAGPVAAPVSAAPAVAAASPGATLASPSWAIAPPAPSASAPPSAAAEPASGSALGIVVFKTRAASWVEVTDAQGMVSLRKMLAPGEVASASGALPLKVVVGRADSTEVEVRGKPFSLAQLTRDNVARFEVK